MTTIVSGCVWCGAIVHHGAPDLPWCDLAGSCRCRAPVVPPRPGHLGHDHGPELNCQACYQTEAPQFARNGPPAAECLEAAMRADPCLTIEEAVRTVPIGPRSRQEPSDGR